MFHIPHFFDLLRNPCLVAAKRLIFHIPRNPMEAPARLQAPYIHMPARLMWMMVMMRRRGMRKMKNRSSREDIIGKAHLVKDELTKNAATSTDTVQESL